MGQPRIRRIARQGTHGRWRWRALVDDQALAFGPVHGHETEEEALRAARRIANAPPSAGRVGAPAMTATGIVAMLVGMLVGRLI